MSHQTIIQNIKGKKFDPIYFLHGEEPYFIDQVMEAAGSILPKAEKAFNEVIMYGKDTEWKQIVDQCSQYPMMAPRRVIILKEAQYLSKIEMLIKYIERPNPMTSLFIGYKKKIDGRKKIFSTLKKNSVVLESKKVKEYKMAEWISNHIRQRKRLIHPDNAQRLSGLLGNQLGKVINEIDKLMVTTPEGQEVTVDLIHKNVGMSKDYNVFELQNALSIRDTTKVFKIAEYFAAHPKENPIPLILANLYGYFSKVYTTKANINLDNRALATKLNLFSPTFAGNYKTAAKHYSMTQIRDVFNGLLEADKAFKGVGSRGAKPETILYDLLFSLFYGSAAEVEI